jgi:transposase-like protein
MGQLDKACSVDFLRRYFVSLFEESPMSNRLSMDKTQGITQLFASGMSQRQIDRALGIDRKSVARELRRSGAIGTTDDKAPTGPVADNEQ